MAAWTHIPGGLRSVSTGKAGTWGVTVEDDIFEMFMGDWRRVGGKMRHVSVGNSIWGVNSIHDIFTIGESDNGRWRKVDGKLAGVSVSNNGHVWGVDGGDQICRRVGDAWKGVEGSAMQVSVGESGVWVVKRSNQIFYRNGTYGDADCDGTGWTQVNGGLKWVASGPGIVVGCNQNDQIYYRSGVCKANPTGDDWVMLTGSLAQIDVDVDFVIGRNVNMDIYKTSVLT